MAVNINCDDGTISSPLQVFGQAKNRINIIFIDVQEYVAYALRSIIGNNY